MAGLKKKKKEPTTSPNVVLIIFLVFFILVTMGLGWATYEGFSGQADLKQKRADAEKVAKAAKVYEDIYKTAYRDLRNAIGEKIPEDEKADFITERGKLISETFGAGSGLDAKLVEEFKLKAKTARDLIEELKKDSELSDAGNDYKTSYKQAWRAAQVSAKEWEGKAVAALAAQKAAEEQFKKLQTNQDTFHTDAKALIQKNNTTAMAAAQANRDQFDVTAKLNTELLKKLTDKDGDIDRLKEEYEKQIKLREFRIKDLRKELADAGASGPGGGAGGGAPVRGGVDPFPLVLDLNMGKPLWDAPVGKVVRVDLTQRQVVINLGSTHGIKPETTFNVFGVNSSGRAEKQMKGSIEVIKVLDSSTSLARITSLYDAEGTEILLNLESRNKFQRENEIPLKDGDLLFNLFWGTRVAVMGYVSITGEASPNNPAEQIRHMDDFMYLLRRNGIQVDAYVDLRDGKIQGNLSSKTRYLIKGEDLSGPSAKPAAPVKEGEDKEKEPAAKEPGVGGDRNDAITKANATLRKEAIENGLLIISAENFANVIGYRKARNANALEASGFRPMLPYAGSIEGGVIRLPDRPPAGEEKKDMEKKD